MRQRLDDDLADGVDAGVGGAVDFEDVHVAAVGDFHAGVALAARLGGRALHAVERARQDARGGRLADAARARKDKGMREPAGRDRVLQRFDDAALADDVFKPLRTPLARQCDVGHSERIPDLGQREVLTFRPEGLRAVMGQFGTGTSSGATLRGSRHGKSALSLRADSESHRSG